MTEGAAMSMHIREHSLYVLNMTMVTFSSTKAGYAFRGAERINR